MRVLHLILHQSHLHKHPPNRKISLLCLLRGKKQQIAAVTKNIIKCERQLCEEERQKLIQNIQETDTADKFSVHLLEIKKPWFKIITSETDTSTDDITN